MWITGGGCGQALHVMLGMGYGRNLVERSDSKPLYRRFLIKGFQIRI